jgi:hypothetical protein
VRGLAWLAAGAAVLVAAVTVLVVVTRHTSTAMPASAAPSAPTSVPAFVPAPGPTPSHTIALPPSTGPALPAKGVYFGAWVAPDVYSQTDRVQAVDALQQQIGHRLDIVHIYLTAGATFPTQSDLAFVDQGSTLLVSWALNDSSAIAAGADDALIRQTAQELQHIGKPVFLEWRWEMDRPGLRAEVGTPAQYIAAWKHIREVFAEEQVTNVAWVWCPSSKGFADGTAGAYYPGDSEVNWICADVYPPSNDPLRSFAATAQPFLDWASHHDKPIIIGEFGVRTVSPPQARAAWLRAAAETVLADPQIKALVYFDGPGQQPGQSCVLSGVALQAFQAIADYNYFDPGGPVLPTS